MIKIFRGRKPHLLQSGVTILETMITISLLTVISGLAAPSFSELIAKTKVTTQANLLIHSLYNARSHAISNQIILLVCKRQADDSCDESWQRGANWNDGWIVFADRNGNNVYDEEEKIFVVPANKDVNLIFNQQGRLRFHPTGSARSAGFYLCHKTTETTKRIHILHTGRVRLSDTLSDKEQQTCLSA